MFVASCFSKLYTHKSVFQIPSWRYPIFSFTASFLLSVEKSTGVSVLNTNLVLISLGVDIKGLLLDVQRKLESKCAHVKFDFKYFINKKAPVSAMEFPVGYDCAFRGDLTGDKYKFILEVKVPITTLCPCSKEISKYSAHNQRTMVKVKVSYDEKDIIWIEDLVEKIESCGSSQVYSILKRCDEKYVTEAAYENPKFVEDVLRDVISFLEEDKKITFYEVEVEAQESIHNHNAWAFQTEDKLAGEM